MCTGHATSKLATQTNLGRAAGFELLSAIAVRTETFRVKPDSHSCISLVFGESFVSENREKQSNPKFLHLNSEIVVSRGLYPNRCLLKGSQALRTMSKDFPWAKISSATSEMYGMEFWP